MYFVTRTNGCISVNVWTVQTELTCWWRLSVIQVTVTKYYIVKRLKRGDPNWTCQNRWNFQSRPKEGTTFLMLQQHLTNSEKVWKRSERIHLCQKQPSLNRRGVLKTLLITRLQYSTEISPSDNSLSPSNTHAGRLSQQLWNSKLTRVLNNFVRTLPHRVCNSPPLSYNWRSPSDVALDWMTELTLSDDLWRLD